MERGVSVIMVTRCRAQRQHTLWAAIESVFQQAGVAPELIMAVNGTAYDRTLFARLKACSRIRMVYQAEASFPSALSYGRQFVTQPYFAMLDDDDVYLPGALQIRLDALERDPSLDFVTTNWYIEKPEGRCLAITDAAPVRKDPLLALFRQNWMGTGASLFRSETIRELPLHRTSNTYEWTQLAFQLLIAGRRMTFLDVPTLLKRELADSAYNVTTPEILQARLSIFDEMLARAPEHVKGAIQARRSEELHDTADYYLRAGDGRRAWWYHLRSMHERSGSRYIRFTARLLLHPMKIAGR